MTPMTTVQVGGTRRTLTLEAIVDTGFDDEICVPLDVGVTLGLELIGERLVEFADGSQKRDLVFAGKARFLKRTRNLEINLTDGEDCLVGTGLLAGCQLSVDFDTGN